MLRALRLRHVYTGMLKPRSHQDMCLESRLDALEDGSTKIGVSLPPEAGKNVTSMSLLGRLQASSGDPKAICLVIVISIELARQAADRARKIFPHGLLNLDKGCSTPRLG